MRPASLVAFVLGMGFSCAPLAQADFSYEDLVGLIKSQGLTRLEDVLARLPEEFRSGYTLLRASRSLQGGTASNPRAILFGKNAKLTCAFNGDPAQRGFDSLECFQFREAERKFDFRQIQFPTTSNALKEVVFSAANESTTGISCTRCHGADPRPNWDSYNFWPGAFGERDDTVDAQLDDYLKFVQVRDLHPRYRWLHQGANPGDPFRIDATYTYYEHRPNLTFSEAVGRLNARRAARILHAVPNWERWTFAAATLRCTLPSDMKRELQRRGFDLTDGTDGSPFQNKILARIFMELKIAPSEWSTQIFDDEDYLNQPWEHLPGHTQFSWDVGMAVLREQADAGDEGSARALRSIKTPGKGMDPVDGNINLALNEILPDLYFTGAWNENLAAVCPVVTRFLQQAFKESDFHRAFQRY